MVPAFGGVIAAAEPDASRLDPSFPSRSLEQIPRMPVSSFCRIAATELPIRVRLGSHLVRILRAHGNVGGSKPCPCGVKNS